MRIKSINHSLLVRKYQIYSCLSLNIQRTHFQGRWDVVSPESWCAVSRQNTDQTRSVPVSCEIGDSCDKKCRPATAAVTAGIRLELHLAGGQRHVRGLMSKTVCGRQHRTTLVLTDDAQLPAEL